MTAAELAGADDVRSLHLHRPLVLDDDAATCRPWSTTAPTSGSSSGRVPRRPPATAPGGCTPPPPRRRATPPIACTAHGEPVDPAALRASLGRRGIGYGDAFAGLESLQGGEGSSAGRVRLPDHRDAADGDHGFRLHPAPLDAALHVLGGLDGLDAGRRGPAHDASSGHRLRGRGPGLVRRCQGPPAPRRRRRRARRAHRCRRPGGARRAARGAARGPRRRHPAGTSRRDRPRPHRRHAPAHRMDPGRRALRRRR